MPFDPINRALNALGGILFVALGLYVAWVDPEDDRNRAFALLAAGFGLNFAVTESGFLLGRPLGRYEPWVVSLLLVLAVVGALWLARALLSEMTDDRTPLLAAGAIGGGLFGAHAVIGSRFAGEIIRWQIQGTGLPWTPAGIRVIQYTFSAMLASLFVVLYGLVLAYGSEVERPRRLEARLVTVALATYLGFVAGANASEGSGVSSGMAWSAWATAVNLAAMVGLAALWLDRSRRVPESKSARNIAVYVLAMPLVGLLVQASGRYFGSYGITRTVAVLVLAYGILKHDLLGIDRKVQWTVSKTTVAGVFVAVFFIVSEGAQVLFAGVVGSQLLGIIAAGALLFALSPIQKAADRIAAKAVPGGAGGTGGDDREHRYRDAVRVALADGEITREEEHELASQAKALGLDPQRALELREQVEDEDGGGEAA